VQQEKPGPAVWTAQAVNLADWMGVAVACAPTDLAPIGLWSASPRWIIRSSSSACARAAETPTESAEKHDWSRTSMASH
jgi:hypothetical protein